MLMAIRLPSQKPKQCTSLPFPKNLLNLPPPKLISSLEIKMNSTFPSWIASNI
jgi:hypothetical protein